MIAEPVAACKSTAVPSTSAMIATERVIQQLTIIRFHTFELSDSKQKHARSPQRPLITTVVLAGCIELW